MGSTASADPNDDHESEVGPSAENENPEKARNGSGIDQASTAVRRRSNRSGPDTDAFAAIPTPPTAEPSGDEK